MSPHVEMYGHGGRWYPKIGTEHQTEDEESEGYKNAEGILCKAALSDDMWAREVADDDGPVCEFHRKKVLEKYPALREREKMARRKEKEKKRRELFKRSRSQITP